MFQSENRMKIKYFVYLIIINFFFFENLNAQQAIIPQKRIYKDSLGRVYVNKDLPLYFKISKDKSSDSVHYLLKNEKTQQYTPIFLGKEGLNLFYSPWAVDTTTKKVVRPKFDVKFEVYADSKPPRTKIHHNIIAYDNQDTIFFGKGLKINFTATDNLSGVDKIFFSINKQAFEQYRHDTLIFDQQGEYFLQYYATDNVGNVEDIQSVHFFIDTTKPLTNLVITGNHIDNIVSANCTVILKPQDAFSGNAKTFYFIDNQSNTVYSKPISVKNLREGLHILHYYSQDKVANTENVNSYEFYLDKTPPIIMPEVIGDYIIINGKKYTSGQTQIQLNAIDNKAGVKDIFYSFDGKQWTKYEKKIDLPKTSGKVSLQYYAVDNVGNTSRGKVNNSENSSNFFMSEMDLVPPQISYSFVGKSTKIFDTLYISPKTKIQIKAYDAKSGVQYSEYLVDNQNSTKYQKPFSISQSGFHEVMITSYDNVNNMQSENLSVFVDDIGPEINYTFSSKILNKNGKIYVPLGAKLFIYAHDKQTDVYKITYSLNNKPPIEYSRFLTFNYKGDYDIKITATDIFGNQTTKEITFTIR